MTSLPAGKCPEVDQGPCFMLEDCGDLTRSSSEFSFCFALRAEFSNSGEPASSLYGRSDSLTHLDSCRSEQLPLTDQDACMLACDELLLSGGSGTSTDKYGAPSPLTRTPSICSLTPAEATSATDNEVTEVFRNELQRELEVRPCSPSQNASTNPASSSMGCANSPAPSDVAITAEMRAVAVSWLVEVATEFSLQQETLFLAVSYLDRFLCCSQSPVPRGMLQLVAVACISLAAKQEEVEQPTAKMWTDISDNCFQREDLVRMEWLVIDTLGWRGRCPTAYSFLHLLCYGLASCSAITICTASYLAELSLLDGSLLQYGYSTLATASLVLAHILTRQAANLDWAAVQALVPNVDVAALKTCMSRLAAIHAMSFCPQAVEEHHMAPVREKYLRPEWAGAACVPAIDPAELAAYL